MRVVGRVDLEGACLLSDRIRGRILVDASYGPAEPVYREDRVDDGTVLEVASRCDEVGAYEDAAIMRRLMLLPPMLRLLVVRAAARG